MKPAWSHLLVHVMSRPNHFVKPPHQYVWNSNALLADILLHQVQSNRLSIPLLFINYYKKSVSIFNGIEKSPYKIQLNGEITNIVNINVGRNTIPKKILLIVLIIDLFLIPSLSFSRELPHCPSHHQQDDVYAS